MTIRRMGHHRSVFAVLVALACANGASYAQANPNASRSVQGYVTGGREPVAQAKVFLKSDETLATRSYLTKGNGAYVFRHIAPNQNYSLWAMKNSKSSRKKHLSVFDRHDHRRIDLALAR